MAEKNTTPGCIVSGLVLLFCGGLFCKHIYDLNRLKIEGKITRGIVTDHFKSNTFYLFGVGNKTIHSAYSNSKSTVYIGDSLYIVYLLNDPDNNAPAIDIFGDKYRH